MEVLLVFIRLFLFGVFALAGIGKLMDLEGSEKAVKGFGVPGPLVKPASFGLPILELMIAMVLLPVSTAWFGSIAASLLLLAFIGGMIYQIARGESPDCHCFGQLHSEPVGKSSLFRNSIFALFALFLAFQGPDGQGASIAESSSEMVQTILLLSLVLLATAALLYLRQFAEQQRQILKRIEVMEIIGSDGRIVERDEAGNPEDGLPIGAPFPDFELPDTSGRLVAFEHLLARSKPILFFFISPDCNPCKALYPEIVEWRKELGDGLDFVIISRGSAEDNIEKFDGAANGFLLQKHKEVAESVMSKWTPTAIFVNANGTIGSRPAVGDTAINELVNWIRTSVTSNDFTYFANGNAALLKIGVPVEQFALEDINGNTVTHEQLVGRPTLAVAWSTTCPFCKEMIAELKDWESSKNEHEPNLLIFSDGKPAEIREFEIMSPVVMDKDFDFSARLGLVGTPSGVLIDENGKIATGPGVGAESIWALVGKRKVKV
jgi:thiol-disulfide isomerase/thioredoxin/uncharacterized membrane protein YphA (DoxX/SURF4 family)